MRKKYKQLKIKTRVIKTSKNCPIQKRSPRLVKLDKIAKATTQRKGEI